MQDVRSPAPRGVSRPQASGRRTDRGRPVRGRDGRPRQSRLARPWFADGRSSALYTLASTGKWTDADTVAEKQASASSAFDQWLGRINLATASLHRGQTAAALSQIDLVSPPEGPVGNLAREQPRVRRIDVPGSVQARRGAVAGTGGDDGRRESAWRVRHLGRDCRVAGQLGAQGGCGRDAGQAQAAGRSLARRCAAARAALGDRCSRARARRRSSRHRRTRAGPGRRRRLAPA